jgi:hypothetical protein
VSIKPPILAELFGGLRERDETAPEVALTVGEVIEALAEWKGCAEPS